MPRRRTSRKAKRSRYTRRRNQRGGDASISDAIVGDAIDTWLKESVAGTWQDDQWKTKSFYEEGWPLLDVKDYTADTYQFTLPKHHRTNIYSIINVTQHPGSLGDPKTADEYRQYLVSLSENPEKPLAQYVTIENILRNKLNGTEMVTEKTILDTQQSLLLWFLANAVKEVPEDAIVGLAVIPDTSPVKDNSAQPAPPAV
jgi:hypothetical protein